MTTRNIFRCPICGVFVMPKDDYRKQLARADAPWHCSTCSSSADHLETQYQCEHGHWVSENHTPGYCPTCAGEEDPITIQIVGQGEAEGEEPVLVPTGMDAEIDKLIQPWTTIATLPNMRRFDTINKAAPLIKLAHANGCYAAGGWPRWCMSPWSEDKVSPYGDIDFFGREQTSVQSFFEALMELDGAELRNSTRWSLHVTLPDTTLETWGLKPGTVLNLIRPDMDSQMATVGDPDRVVGRFDFTVSAAWIEWNETHQLMEFRCHSEFHRHERERELHLLDKRRPLSLIQRLMKYSRKGYSAPPKTIITVCMIAAQYEPVLQTYREWLHGEQALTEPELLELYRAM